MAMRVSCVEMLRTVENLWKLIFWEDFEGSKA
jgi:hypothetical protein